MSYSSMTLKNVMGGCELLDFKSPTVEKSWLIDLSLIGVNVRELQKNIIPNVSDHNQNNTDVESVISTCTVMESEFRGESRGDQSKNNNVCNVQDVDDEMIKSSSQLEPDKTERSLELFDLNANKIVEAKPNESPQPVFTTLQNFYETFDVSDEIESMTAMEYIADTPSSASTGDSFYEQDLVIYEPPTPTVNHPNLEAASDTSPTNGDKNEDHFIPSSVISRESTIYPLLVHTITKRGLQCIDKSNASLEPKKKKRKPGRVPKKPSVEKNISCSLCSKKFRTEAHLKVHFMVHVDSECMHSCAVCKRRFCHRGALTLHLRRHASTSAFGIPR